ncbi:LacI family DNA-binding transcriptional regulator [Shimia sp.]|uniref:LacI family DNA-binding transcriptional regulator n=1 Tax=Shimia sp. TaxID=1954381 RepID=UPI003296DCE3
MPDFDDSPTAKRATLMDVARLADVSMSAVSRSFTPGASVSPSTRQRVMKAAKEIGFQPNVLARSLATGRSDMIALVTNAFANPFINSVVDAFTSELQERKLLPVAFNLKGNFDWDQAVDLILQYQVDGVIVASSTVDERFLERICDAKIPLIQAFGRFHGVGDVDSVFVDNTHGGRHAAREFIARGYEKPGFIGVSSSVSTTQDRLAGFAEVWAEKGIEPVVKRAENYAYADGYAGASELFRDNPQLDCVFCADDLLGIGAIDALRFECHRRIPDVGVIGFNDIQATGWASHPLSTFRADTTQVVASGIEMLKDRIKSAGKAREQRVVNCQFVERGSLRPHVI